MSTANWRRLHSMCGTNRLYCRKLHTQTNWIQIDGYKFHCVWRNWPKFANFMQQNDRNLNAQETWDDLMAVASIDRARSVSEWEKEGKRVFASSGSCPQMDETINLPRYNSHYQPPLRIQHSTIESISLVSVTLSRLTRPIVKIHFCFLLILYNI